MRKRRNRKRRGCGCLSSLLVWGTLFIVIYHTSIPPRLFVWAFFRDNPHLTVNGLRGSIANGFQVQEFEFTEEGKSKPDLTLTNFRFKYRDLILAMTTRHFVIRDFSVDGAEIQLTSDDREAIDYKKKGDDPVTDEIFEVSNLDLQNLRLFAADGSADIRIRSIRAKDFQPAPDDPLSVFNPDVEIERIFYQNYSGAFFLSRRAQVIPQEVTLTMVPSEKNPQNLETGEGHFQLGLTQFEIPRQSVPASIHMAGLQAHTTLASGEIITATLVRSPDTSTLSNLVLQSKNGHVDRGTLSQIYFKKSDEELTEPEKKQIDRISARQAALGKPGSQ